MSSFIGSSLHSKVLKEIWKELTLVVLCICIILRHLSPLSGICDLIVKLSIHDMLKFTEFGIFSE